MKEVVVKLNNLEDAASFVNILEKQDIKGKVSEGGPSFNASSLMGILTMDLNKPLKLKLKDDGECTERVIDALKHFVVE